MTLLLASCATRTIVVRSDSGLVRLGGDVTGHVYTWQNGQWTLSGNKLLLPEGWFAGPANIK
jgi:hypothetical protein